MRLNEINKKKNQILVETGKESGKTVEIKTPNSILKREIRCVRDEKAVLLLTTYWISQLEIIE